MPESQSKLQSPSRSMMALDSLRAVTTDLGEGGMAVQLAHRPKNLGSVIIQFALPGSET